MLSLKDISLHKITSGDMNCLQGVSVQIGRAISLSRVVLAGRFTSSFSESSLDFDAKLLWNKVFDIQPTCDTYCGQVKIVKLVKPLTLVLY